MSAFDIASAAIALPVDIWLWSALLRNKLSEENEGLALCLALAFAFIAIYSVARLCGAHP